MKKILSLLIAASVILTGCANASNVSDTTPSETTTVSSSESSSEETLPDDYLSSEYLDDEAQRQNFRSLSDPELLDFMEGALYSHLVDELGEDEFIDNVEAVYISQEFIDELSYNSKANVFFGYTLKELDEQFKGTSYIFTVENGQTVVKPRSPYDDTYDKMIQNVAIGTGVILICVTISVVTYGAGAPAASMIFATAAKSGAIMGVSSGAISGVATGIVSGIKTNDWDQALKEGALAASESFKFSVIAGSIMGGAGEAIGLHNVANATKLTMDEVATIQRESKLPLSLIKEFQSMDQYNIIKESGMYGKVVDGKSAIIRNIDLNYTKDGVTNLERMLQGSPALDPKTGLPYELHHMGQTQDATIAILTQAEHRGVGNHSIWHDLLSPSNVDHGTKWATQKKAFWISLAKSLAK